MFRMNKGITTLGITKSGTNNTKSTIKVLHISELAVRVQEAMQTSKKQ